MLFSMDNPFSMRYLREYSSFPATFQKHFRDSFCINIAIGYVSSSSIEWLIANTKKQKINLFIGQHFYEGLTPLHVKLLKKLCLMLNEENGDVRVIRGLRYHGKVYQFNLDNQSRCYVGSSNLNDITEGHESFEVNAEVNDIEGCNKLFQMLQSHSKSFNDVKEDEFKLVSKNILMSQHRDVMKVDINYIDDIKNKTTDNVFEIELKTSEKSNLNIFNGTGRKRKDGSFQPRSWYEAEIIVSRTITGNEAYPKGVEFYVVTDDGYKFICTTSGSNNKNFRSVGKLGVLGYWIKGKLVSYGVLEEGQLLTNEVLEEYGNKFIRLIETSESYGGLPVWYLEYKFKGDF
ncbi:restriction endonuclease PLD domain-containing protein [Halobacteriovorax sp. DPLXC-1]|uniref:restriction endonuclease PLD domain-containing protein n=1 Tax=Halobacteriovorax sp. DPLXC-1 TaxID=3110771 RepID=UPI002FF11A11